VRRGVALALGGLALLAAGGVAWRVLEPAEAQTLADPGDAAQVARGAVIYAEACAACHGAELEGAANWREPGPDGRLPAPPHDETGHSWHHGDRLLFDYTKLGGAGALAKQGVTGFDSGMPAFEGVLTDQEIWDALAYIKSEWPEDVRAAQAERDALARQGEDG
jgi:mono/diheme cytochrome c family protein